VAFATSQVLQIVWPYLKIRIDSRMKIGVKRKTVER
jgi:hypothetical protein